MSPLDLLWLCLIVISLQPPISAQERRSGGASRLTSRGAAGVRRGSWSRTAAQPR